LKSNNQILPAPVSEIILAIKREDQIHPLVPGNKFRKLKYNLLEAERLHCKTLLTFGGAFSNHIAAVAATGREHSLATIGIIRGEELSGKIDQNPTLRFAKECGMRLEFVSREDYRNKDKADFIEKLQQQFGGFYLIPEGGTNNLAIKGCEEILTAGDLAFDYICCPVGTGGTIAGLVNTAAPHQKVLGFPALKGDFLKEEIRKFAPEGHLEMISEYHFGGYAKVDSVLIAFLNDFYQQTGILLDPVYTGKMVFGVMDLIRNDYFPKGSKILMIHTGGTQGIEGMNHKLKNLKLPLIDCP
jgi:1-aminocyclopropane-1-carboxylate deaminase